MEKGSNQLKVQLAHADQQTATKTKATDQTLKLK